MSCSSTIIVENMFVGMERLYILVVPKRLFCLGLGCDGVMSPRVVLF